MSTLKDWIFALLRLLPSDLQNDIIFRKQMLTKNRVLRKWEQRGKPVPPPHLVKQSIVTEYQKLSKFKVLVETGTFLGHMIDTQKGRFDLVYSIELSPKYWKKAKRKFRKDSHVKLILGDSASELPHVVAELDSPAIFWLDGHYSLGTARGDLDCPIFEEITSILKSPIKNHILLIDDARDFNGTNDYPDLEELQTFVLQKRPKASFEVKDDVVRIKLN